MNNVESSSADFQSDQLQFADVPPPEAAAAQPTTAETPFEKPKITGFDPENRPFYKDVSLYLSIFVVFIVALVSFSKTPVMFWIAFAAMSALALCVHLSAEQTLFKGRKEFQYFSAPLEGIFVLTLGAIIPGLALVAYSSYALASSQQHANPLMEFSKLGLLLAVPAFNFSVWSAIRKGYLARPRLVGLMNGLAVGLSVSWSVIWLKCLLFQMGTNCNFGWMLLLCASPFMLFGATCLAFDLRRKTEARMSSITTTFSLLGGFLSLLFVFTPMISAISMQSLLTQARSADTEVSAKAIATLRSSVPPEDLCIGTKKASGFTLAEMLIPNQTLDIEQEADKDLFFKITGTAPIEPGNIASSSTGIIAAQHADGLSLVKSQISGTVNPVGLSSSLDWTMTLRNTQSVMQEASTEIALPKGAVVSRVTLWIDGKPCEAAFANTAKVRQAFDAVTQRKRDPLLVTFSAKDRVLVRCFPIPPFGGDTKMRIGFKIPLRTVNGKECTMELPRLLSANFAQPKRHRISLNSSEPLTSVVPGLNQTKRSARHIVNGIIRVTDPTPTVLRLARTNTSAAFATRDTGSKDRFIVNELRPERVSTRPKSVLFVVDSSHDMESRIPQIKRLISSLPAGIENKLVVVPEGGNAESNESTLNTQSFVGGKDNEPTLRGALETAAETPESAVIWLHGPQPIAQTAASTDLLDLVHAVTLYDVQLIPGASNIVKRVQQSDAMNLLTVETVDRKRIGDDISNAFENQGDELLMRRTLVAQAPDLPIVTDKDIAAQSSSLWATEQVSKLLARGEREQAHQLASKYRLVTPVTGAVVLESEQDYKAWHLDNGDFREGESNETYRGTSQWSGGGGLVGAPVDPRFGQSNEIGQLADYGYDTARDIGRILTILAFIISLVVAGMHVRSQRKVSLAPIAKGAALILFAPLIVHLVCTFMINNFGGLGGGL
jgi:hypothetical protein